MHAANLLTTALIATATLAVSRPDAPTPVDVCEVNHVLFENPEQGTRFTQVILWRWIPVWNDHHVAQWMMAEADSITVLRRERHRVTWRDRHGKVFRVRARTFRETWTRHDPEMLDRAKFSESARRAYL